ALEDEVTEVRRAVVSALWRIGPAEEHNEALVKALAKTLRGRDARVRQVAGFSLTGLGPAARGAVPALAKAPKGPEARVRGTAATALGAIGPGARAAVPALLEALKDEDADVRRSAAGALKEIDPAAARKALAR